MIPTVKNAECLILPWQRDTPGWDRERQSLEIILEQCRIIGAGRVRQLAEGIRELIDDPDGAKAKYANMRREHFERMGWKTEERT